MQKRKQSKLRGFIMKFLMVLLIAVGLLAIGAVSGGYVAYTQEKSPKPITLQAQGSFFVGGTVITVPGTFDPI